MGGRTTMALGIAMLTLAVATAGGGERPAHMPWPSSIERGAGELVVGPGFRVAVLGKGGSIVDRAARRLEARLARQTGLVLPSPVAVPEKATLEIRCDAPGSALPHLGMDELAEYEALLRRYENLWLDTTMAIGEYFAVPVPPTLFPELAERMLYGTDFPNLPYAWDRELHKVLTSGLAPTAQRQLLWGNAARLFD